MRRISAYAGLIVALALMALLPSACSIPETPMDLLGQNVILLQVGKPFLETKATERGDEDMNENQINRADFFFYPDGKTDRDAVLTAIGRTVEKKTGVDSTVWVAKIYCTDDEKTALFGSGTSGTCQVFMVANNYGSYGEATDVASLKATLVQQDFPSFSEDNTQGKQAGLIMSSSGTDAVSLTGSSTGEVAVGRIEAFRAVAKMKLYFRMNLPQVPDGESHAGEYYYDDGPGNRYYPILSGENIPFVELQYTLTKGRVEGTYTPESGDYAEYGYDQRIPVAALVSPLEVQGKQYSYVQTVPFYSFPQVWSDFSEIQPKIVLHIRWKKNEQSEAQAEWYEYDISPYVGHVLERNHYYRTLAEISSLGWGINNEPVTLPCSYVISDWVSENGSKEPLANVLDKYSYLVVDTNERVLFSQDTATFNYVSSSNMNYTATMITAVRFYDYVIDLNNPQVYTPSSPGWTTTNSGMVWTSTFTHTRTVNGTPTAIPETVTLDMSKMGVARVSHSLEDRYVAYEIDVLLQNREGLTQQLTIKQYPAIYIETFDGGNVFVNGYFANVEFPDSDLSGYMDRYVWNEGDGQTINHPLRWAKVPGASSSDTHFQSASANGMTSYCIGYTDFYNPSQYIDYMDFVVQKGYMQTGIITHYGTIMSKTVFDQFFSGRGDIIKVNLTAFNSDNYSYTVTHTDSGERTWNYRIGDPRIASGFDDTSLSHFLHNMHPGYVFVYHENGEGGQTPSVANATHIKLSSSGSSYNLNKHSWANHDRNTVNVSDYSTRIPKTYNGHDAFDGDRKYIDLTSSKGVSVEEMHDYNSSRSGDFWMNSSNTIRLNGTQTVDGVTGDFTYEDYKIYSYYNSGWRTASNPNEFVYLFYVWYGNFTEWSAALSSQGGVASIKIGTTDLEDANLIAPEFLVGSAWGAESGNVAITFDQAQKRCATYQEKGYPAGRWRLPTEAELMFCIQRQEEGLIPTTFDLREGNWASSGYYYQNKNNTGAKFYQGSGGEVAFLRCVYDSWYWGDQPYDAEAQYFFTPRTIK